jgi:hypothetical protein
VGSLERLLPGAKIRHDVHIQGVKSGRQRQIDVLVERDLGGFRLAIAVDCKYSVIAVTMRYAKVAAEVKTDAVALLDPKPALAEESSGTTAAHGPKEAVQAA